MISKRFFWLIIIPTVFFIVLVLWVTPYSKTPDRAQMPIAAVTIYPLYDIVRNVAGEVARVILIAPPGASPHTFEVNTENVRDLQSAQLIFAVGHGLDSWITKIQDALPEAKLVIPDADIALRDFEEGEKDPHYFLSIKNAKIIAKNTARALSLIDPAQSAVYAANAGQYIIKLDDADRRIREIFKSLKNKKVIMMHDAWGYFAEEYGLEVLTTFQESPGQSPTPRHLAELSRLVKENGIKTIFSEIQLSDDVLGQLLKDLKVKSEPLAPDGGLPGYSYIQLMEYNAKKIYDGSK